jgi:small basic protein (TIGR04137 family)
LRPVARASGLFSPIRDLKREKYLSRVLQIRNSLTFHPFQPARPLPAMSQHNSLQGAKGIVIKRNVLKRFERVELLKKRGQWKEGDRGYGLRKTKADA